MACIAPVSGNGGLGARRVQGLPTNLVAPPAAARWRGRT